MQNLQSTFITKGGYLSILQSEFDNYKGNNIGVGLNIFDSEKLRRSITYTDSTDSRGLPIYRWNKNAVDYCKLN